MRAQTRNFLTTGSKKRHLNQVTAQSEDKKENLDSESRLNSKRVKLDPFSMMSKPHNSAKKTKMQ